jgi:hypothetical protein
VLQSLSVKAKLKELREVIDYSSMTAATGNKAAETIFARAAESWKKEHEGQAPATANEKTSFYNRMEQSTHEENFTEAMNEAYTAYVTRDVPYEV